MPPVEPRLRDRAILGLLLAFLVWTLLPAFAMRTHRHVQSDVFHTHLTPPARAPEALGNGDDERAPAPAGVRIETAAAAGWHCHVSDPFHHASVEAATTLAPGDLTAALVIAALVEPPTAPPAAAKARAPPIRPS